MNNTCKGGEVRVNIKELKERKVELLEEMENMTKDISLFNSAKFGFLGSKFVLNEFIPIKSKITAAAHVDSTLKPENLFDFAYLAFSKAVSFKSSLA